MEGEAMAFRLNANSIFRLILSVVVVLSLCGALRLDAQVTGGTISGTVTDATGGAVPKVEVSITNTATGLVTTVTTTSEGFYSVPNLLPGPYQVTAKAAGFSTAVTSGVTLTVGAQQAVNIALKVGETSQQVEVTTTAVAVELVSSAISSVVVGTTVRELPLNGRSWTDLAQLQPGLNNITTQPAATTSDRASRGWGAILTISGARGTANNYRLNGVSLNDSFNAAPGSFTTGNLGVDAIGEFSVLTGNFSAEYGKSSGGVINAITRSGTNQIHGTAFEFLRNKVFDAKNFFNPFGKPSPPFVRNQFGAAAGGPIQKEKMFVFGNYEGLREALSSTKVISVPSPAARLGNLCAAPDCSTTNPVTIAQPACATATPPTCSPLTSLPGLPYVNLWPLPTTLSCPFASCAPNTGNLGKVTTVLPSHTSENYFTTRVDRKLGDKDTMFGTYVRDRQTQNARDPLGALQTTREIFRQTYSVEESHAFTPSVINVVRFGFHRQLIANPSSAKALNPIAGDTTLGLTAGQTIGRIQVPGLESFPGGLTLFQASKSAWNSYQVYDDLFITKGIHALKFGFALEKDQRNNRGPGGFAGGRSIFGSYTKFLQGSPSALIANSGVDNPGPPPSSLGDLSSHLHQWIYGAYIQDDIRLRPRLTINLGLRYEYATTIDSKNTGVISSLQCITCAFPIISHPINANPVLAAVVAAANPQQVYGPITHPSRWNYAPRVGFAWDPFGNGKTAIRAAFGIYDILVQFPMYGSATGASWPALQSTNTGTIPAATWPKGTFSAAAVNLNTKRTDFMEQNPPTSYAMQWNLNIQHEITSTLSAQVGYVGTRTIHNVNQMNDGNIRFPNLASGQPLWQCGPGTIVVTNPAADCPLFPSEAHLAGINGPPSASNPGGLDLITHPLNCCTGRMPMQNFNSNALYDGLQVGVTKAMGHGLMVRGSYTFSKNIDTGSGSGIADPYVNALINTVYFWDPKLRRALADTDMRHNLVISYTYVLPTLSSAPFLVRAVAGGWQTGAIITLQRGLPFTPRIGGDGADSTGMGSSDAINWPDRVAGPACASSSSLVNHTGDRLNYINTDCYAFPAPVAFQGSTWLRTGTASRNTIIGPGLMNVNFSLFKNNYIPRISETTNLQFRFEAFNVFNRPNFLAPVPEDEQLFDIDGTRIPGAGRIGETTTTSRQLQFALKLIF
jgi:hypothetical protein